jgi:hypothetical protein
MNSLEGQVRQGSARIELLQRQLVLSHLHQPRNRPSTMHEPSIPVQEPAAVAHTEAADAGPRRKLPLLWDGMSPEGAGRSVARLPLAPVPEQQESGQTLWPEKRTASTRPLASSPTRGSASNAVGHRAVALHDDVASEPIAVERMLPVEPRLAQPFTQDACRSVSIRDNRAEMSAAIAWTEAEEAHDVQLHRELKRQADANSQELRVVKASIASQVLHARVAKLGSTRHYSMLSMMRALCKWALLLELDHSYHAALTQAASVVQERAEGLASSLVGAQEQTVKALLVEPQMLGELGEMRRKLQAVHCEAESLRSGLSKLCERHGSSMGLDTAAHLLPLEHGRTTLAMEGTAAGEALLQSSGASDGSAVRATEVVPSGSLTPRRALRMAEREVDAMRLMLRLTLHHWRGSRKTLQRQHVLLGQLSAQRNEELEAAEQQVEMLRRSQTENHELLVERETWRRQSAQQADVIAAAMSATTSHQAEHAEEVALLCAKLRQLLEERNGLQALCDSQTSDLKLMSQEMIRLMGSEGIASAAMIRAGP